MKKIITFALFCFILSSCDDENIIKVSKEEYNTLKGLPQQKILKVRDNIYEITMGSDSCEYYQMRVGTGGYGWSLQYFHYPQCSYCKKNIK